MDQRTMSLAALALGAVLITGGISAASQTHAQEAPPVRQFVTATMESQLDQAVADGTITAEQKQRIIMKLEEMHLQLKNIKNLPKEQWRAEFKRIHDEIQAWAKEQGINQTWWNGSGRAPSPHEKHHSNFGYRADIVRHQR